MLSMYSTSLSTLGGIAFVIEGYHHDPHHLIFCLRHIAGAASRILANTAWGIISGLGFIKIRPPVCVHLLHLAHDGRHSGPIILLCLADQKFHLTLSFSVFGVRHRPALLRPDRCPPPLKQTPLPRADTAEDPSKNAISNRLTPY